MGGKIAYIMSRFPHLPETFILREMGELERLGYEVALYPLIVQRVPLMHEEAQRWLGRVRRLPFVSGGVVAANGRALWRGPGAYGALWARTVTGNAGSVNFLARAAALLPMAVYAAEAMVAEGVSHVHAHYATHPALVAWVVQRLTGIGFSVTVHAHDIFVQRAMLGMKLREARFVAAISEFNREYLAGLYGPWVKEKTFVVRCGIVPGDYRPRAVGGPSLARGGVRDSGQAGGDRFEVIHVGSLQPYKGQRYLVEACALLRDRGIPFRCRIVGGGEEEGNLRRLIATLGLEGMVELVGPATQAEVARLLPTADCYVQPSVVTESGKMEGIPVALMEAMACGLPVVATDLSGVPELVRPGVTGRLVRPGDGAALAEAMAWVYGEEAEAMAMAAAGRELVLREFVLSNNVRQLADLFERFAGVARPGGRPQRGVVSEPLVADV